MMTSSNDRDREPEPTGGSGTRDATYNDQGDLTGPDSPAGEGAAQPEPGQAQGDDLADRLGGGEGKGAAIPLGRAGSGNLEGGRSEETRDPAPASGTGDDAGAPGGMGGPEGRTGNPQDRPPGGNNPVPAEEAGQRGDGP
jgi:hypothetical protein